MGAGIAALFITYLMQRLHPFPLINLIIVFLLIWGAIFFILMKYLKVVHPHTQTAWELRITLILAGVLALIFGFFGTDIFLYNYRPTVVMFEAMPQTDSRSAGSNVTLSRVVSNHHLWWAEQNTLFYQIAVEDGYAPRDLEFEYSTSINLVFQYGPNAGVVRIQDGVEETTQNLYAPQDGEFFIYKVQSNHWVAWNVATVVRVLGTLGLLYVSLYMTIKSILVEYRQHKSFFCVAMVAVLLLSLFYYSHFDGLIQNPDSSRHLYYFQNGSGIREDVFIYPVFVQLCKALFGAEHYMFGIVGLQAALSFVAAVFFYRTLQLLIPYHVLPAIGTVLFAANPAVLTWNLCYLTESLSMTGATIWLYFVIKFICNPSRTSLLASVGIATVLVFLRPTFLLLLGLLLGFFIGRLIFTKQTQKLNKTGLVTSLGAFALVGVYAFLFSQQYGYFSISNALPRQQMYVCVNEGFYMLSQDSIFIEQVEEAKRTIEEPWETATEVLRHYSGKEALEITSNCQKAAGMDYIRYVLRLMKEYAAEPYPTNSMAGVSKPLVFPQLLNVLYLGHIYILILVEIAVSIATWVRRKQPQWQYLGLGAYMLLIIVASFTATNGEFMRTGSSVLPFAYCSLMLGVSAMICYANSNDNLEGLCQS